MRTDTIFQIMSMSKPITVVGIMALPEYRGQTVSRGKDLRAGWPLCTPTRTERCGDIPAGFALGMATTCLVGYARARGRVSAKLDRRGWTRRRISHLRLAG